MRLRVPRIAWLLITLPASAQSQTSPFQPHRLSPFEARKAQQLLQARYPCMGCHVLGETGGRVGPSLTGIGARRSPEFIFQMVSDPQATVPGTIMPRVPMSPGTRELIVNYLVQQPQSRSPAPPGSPPLDRGSAGPTGDGPAALYGRYCAVCHGATGDGRGPNAEFLAVRPAALGSAGEMSTRPDDSLFDTISAGGYVMSRSNFMPPFGETLTRDEIWSLVGYLRTLCRCTGPAWSRDNQ